jgi:hypothetical protein
MMMIDTRGMTIKKNKRKGMIQMKTSSLAATTRERITLMMIASS